MSQILLGLFDKTDKQTMSSPLLENLNLYQALEVASLTDFRVTIKYNNSPPGKYSMWYVINDDETYITTNRYNTRTLVKDELFRFFMTQKTTTVSIGNVLVWSHRMKPASIIQRAWRRHRIRTTRDKNDLVLRGLAEYFGHPRFQDFSV